MLAVAGATLAAGSDVPSGRAGPVSLVVAFGVLLAVSVVMGVFGREFALIVVALCGVWVTLSAVSIVRVVLDDTIDLLGALVFVLGACVAAFFVAWLGWFIGTIVCVSKGHFTSRALSEIAYGRNAQAAGGGASVYDDVLDELTRRCAGDDRVTARSMAIERRSTWHRPLAVIATDRQLVMAPMNPEGQLDDEVLAIPSHAVASASVSSLNRDGSARRSSSSHDDLIDITTADGSRCRLVLAYETKVRTKANASPDPVGGADAIRHWVRTNASTYH